MPEQDVKVRPRQTQVQPGLETQMRPRPEVAPKGYRAAGKLMGKVAIVTGGDSGIGRSVAVLFAKEGADVAIVYLEEHDDAAETRRMVETEGRKCVCLAGDLGDEDFCRYVAEETVRRLGKLDILVNNAGEQHVVERLEDITPAQLERTFRTNIFSMFHLTRHALPHLGRGSCIVNTTSVTAYRGSSHLVDYASTKGAIVAFTRSLAAQLAEREIRVNAVAPGPIWTPLIPASFPAEKVASFGEQTPMKRVGEPWEAATCFVFLAGPDASYLTGQVLHPNGGEPVSG